MSGGSEAAFGVGDTTISSSKPATGLDRIIPERSAPPARRSRGTGEVLPSGAATRIGGTTGVDATATATAAPRRNRRSDRRRDRGRGLRHGTGRQRRYDPRRNRGSDRGWGHVRDRWRGRRCDPVRDRWRHRGSLRIRDDNALAALGASDACPPRTLQQRLVQAEIGLAVFTFDHHDHGAAGPPSKTSLIIGRYALKGKDPLVGRYQRLEISVIIRKE